MNFVFMIENAKINFGAISHRNLKVDTKGTYSNNNGDNGWTSKLEVYSN